MLWPFEYFRPQSPSEVDDLLASFPDARLMAGGTNLIIDMERGKLRPAQVIDLKRVEGLDRAEAAGSGPAFIGAAVPINRIQEAHALPYGCVTEALPLTATYQVRNRATAVGNLCNASPAADLAPPLMVLDAQVLLRGPEGERRVPASEFLTGPGRTAAGKAEWVLGLEVPAWSDQTRSCFLKKQRVQGHDLAMVNLAALLDPERGRLRLAVGACAPRPLLFELDGLYAEVQGPEEAFGPADALIQAAIAPISDLRGSAEYRREMLKVQLRQALAAIWS